MKDHLANPTLGTIQARNHGPTSSGKSYRVSINSSASRFEAELEVPNTVQAINAETVLLRVEVLRERLGRTLVLFRDTLGPHAWTERPRGLDGRVTWVKDEGPLWVPRELVSIDENEKFVRELAEQLLKLIREHGTRSDEVLEFAQAHNGVDGFMDLATMLLLAAEANKP